jgi:CBS domain-containing protein
MNSTEAQTSSIDGATAISTGDGFTMADSATTFLIADPTHRVGQLNLARKKPISVKPKATISEAITLMMTHDFSQLPVMVSSRNVRGIFSWKSLAQKLTFGKNPVSVSDAMENAVIIDANRSLFEAARLVAESDYVLIKTEDDTICGILTSYDLSVTFAERSEPFLLLEQIEKHIRNHIEGKISLTEIREVRASLDGESLSPAKLSFGDYVRILQAPERWKKVGLLVDQAIFVGKLEEVRNIRNKVMHFNPNGLASEDLNKLREFAGLLRQIQEAMK